ncbi:hypothetical protein EON65_49145 [archaeon]|nr:MAG: hypothetical protein EON65_49145 [archaeon]
MLASVLGTLDRLPGVPSTEETVDCASHPIPIPPPPSTLGLTLAEEEESCKGGTTVFRLLAVPMVQERSLLALLLLLLLLLLSSRIFLVRDLDFFISTDPVGVLLAMRGTCELISSRFVREADWKRIFALDVSMLSWPVPGLLEDSKVSDFDRECCGMRRSSGTDELDSVAEVLVIMLSPPSL